MHEYRVLDGERGYRYVATKFDDEPRLPSQTWIVLGFATTYAAYLLFKHLDLAILSPFELVWNAIVFLAPTRFINLLARVSGTKGAEVETVNVSSNSEERAAKSKALRTLLRLDNSVTRGTFGLHTRQQAQVVTKLKSEAPAGLGNWDNSCYQNSILQGLASLPSFKAFLDTASDSLGPDSTTITLQGLTDQLTGFENNGKYIWTPAKLKSMSSWQQQDAQEYFSRLLDDVEKEAKQQYANNPKGTFSPKQIESSKADGSILVPRDIRASINPLEGLLGQRVACVECGYSEGLTLLPFNCLTVSLGQDHQYTLQDRLDEYTRLEDIEGVECISCTLRRQETRLQTLVTSFTLAEHDTSGTFAKTAPELQQVVSRRLQDVRDVLETHEFNEQALKRCAVPTDAKVSTTKTKQVVVARAPRTLAIHVNRSIFDEMTGALRKNGAFVSYPKTLSLRPWALGRQDGDSDATEVWSSDPQQSMASPAGHVDRQAQLNYVLKAVVTHYGRHENGHYVCFRQHPPQKSGMTESEDISVSSIAADSSTQKQWWRLSDEDVSRVSEEEMLSQTGVFMLFYERIEDEKGPEVIGSDEQSSDVSAPVVLPIDPDAKVLSEVNAVVYDDATAHDVDLADNASVQQARIPPGDEKTSTTEVVALQRSDALSSSMPVSRSSAVPSPQRLRTARAKAHKNSASLSAGFHAVAAQ